MVRTKPACCRQTPQPHFCHSCAGRNPRSRRSAAGAEHSAAQHGSGRPSHAAAHTGAGDRLDSCLRRNDGRGGGMTEGAGAIGVGHGRSGCGPIWCGGSWLLTPHLTSPLSQTFEKSGNRRDDERHPIWSARGRLPPESAFSKVCERGRDELGKEGVLGAASTASPNSSNETCHACNVKMLSNEWIEVVAHEPGYLCPPWCSLASSLRDRTLVSL